MTISAEKAIGMTAKLYELRRTAKVLYGKDYPEKVTEALTMLKGLADLSGRALLSEVIAACKDVQARYPGESAATVALICAAYVEDTEPSEEYTAYRKGKP